MQDSPCCCGHFRNEECVAEERICCVRGLLVKSMHFTRETPNGKEVFGRHTVQIPKFSAGLPLIFCKSFAIFHEHPTVSFAYNMLH